MTCLYPPLLKALGVEYESVSGDFVEDDEYRWQTECAFRDGEAIVGDELDRIKREVDGTPA